MIEEEYKESARNTASSGCIENKTEISYSELVRSFVHVKFALTCRRVYDSDLDALCRAAASLIERPALVCLARAASGTRWGQGAMF